MERSRECLLESVAMYFLYIFCAIPALALLYAAYIVRRDAQRVPRQPASELWLAPWDSIHRSNSGEQNERPVESIPADQFDELAHRLQDLILIDLRSRRWQRPTVVPVVHTLTVAPNQLRDLLSWLPPGSSVALYSAADLHEFVIATVCHLPGIAPVYVMKESPEYDTPSRRQHNVPSSPDTKPDQTRK
jgi:hypothetical protein